MKTALKIFFQYWSDAIFRLSSLQVVLILLVCGSVLLSITWHYAQEFGYVPVSLWDICTSVVPETALLHK